MRKFFLIIIAIVLITVVIEYRYISHEKNQLSNDNKYSSVEGMGRDINSCLGAKGEKSINVPSNLKDNGIFSDYYVASYKKLSTLSLQDKVGQMILARCSEKNAITSISNYKLGGFVLFEEDFKNKTFDNVVSAIDSYQNVATIPMIMAVDEEGGTVVRISNNLNLTNKKFQSPQEIYANGGLKAIRIDALKKAEILKPLKLNVNLAPVADVSINLSDYIYKRTLGKSAG